MISCCLDDIKEFGEGACDAYMEYYVSEKDASRYGLPSGAVILCKSGLDKDDRPPRLVWRDLIQEFKVPMTYHFSLLIQVMIRLRFHVLERRQQCLGLRVMALSALSQFALPGFPLASLPCVLLSSFAHHFLAAFDVAFPVP